MVDRPTTSRVVVIGGGISGLAAAHRLSKAGARVVLLEKGASLGGKVATENADGFLIEAGPDSFVAGKASVLELAGELGLTDRVIASRPEYRGSYVWRQGRLHPLPEGLLLMAPSRLAPLFRSSLLSWRGKIRILGDFVIPRRRGGDDESLESFVVRRLGREVLDRIAQPLVAGIHAAEPGTMSLRASFPRFLDMEREHRSLLLAARSAASQRAPGGMSHFASFKGGMGELVTTLVGALTGVEIKTGVAVTRLTSSADGAGFRVTLEDGTEYRAQGVVLAAPAREAARLLQEMLPAAASVIAGIHQVATATVTLAYRSDQIPRLPGSGFVVPSGEQRQIMGVSVLSQKWEGRVPDSRFTLLRAFMGGVNGQELALSGPDRQLAVVQEELAAMVGLTATPVLVRSNAWEGGLHQYTLGHLERVAVAESAVAQCPGLALAGAAFHGIGLNECIRSGRNAAEIVLERSPAILQAPAHLDLSSEGDRD